jgi:hypothetical protein
MPDEYKSEMTVLVDFEVLDAEGNVVQTGQAVLPIEDGEVE